ncbi:MAG: hypothetical protein AAFV80_04245 [Bacteroidota bacterium]
MLFTPKRRTLSLIVFIALCFSFQGCSLIVAGLVESMRTPSYSYDDYDYEYGTYGKITQVDSLPKIDSIWAAIPPQEKRTPEAPATPSVVSRYLNGETGLVDELIRQLDSGNDSLVSTMLYQLQGRWPDKPEISDPALIQAIFRTIDRPDLRYTTFQTIGYLDLPGYPAHFDSLLRTDSKYLLFERLRYWMAVKGDQLSTLEFLIDKTKDPLLDQNTKQQIIFSINDFFAQGNGEVQKTAEAFLMEYVSSRMVPDIPLDSIFGSSWEDPLSDALIELMRKGESPQLFDLAQRIIDDGTEDFAALYSKIAIFRMVPVDSFSNWAHLYQNEYFSSMLDLFELGIFPKTQEAFWVNELLSNYSSDGDQSYSDARLARLLIELDYLDFDQQVAPYIEDEQLRTFIGREYTRLNETQEGFIKSLLELNLIDDAKSQELRALQLDVDTTYGPPEIIYNLMDKGGLNWEPYVEYENMPLDYDSIFNEFVALADIDFPDFELKVEYLEVDEYEEEQHRLYLKSDEVLLYGDSYLYSYGYYDIELVLKLLNEFLNLSGESRRFLTPYNDGEYFEILFGEEAAWRTFYEKYGMEYVDYDYDY